MRPCRIIGLAGGTASGKTTLARDLCRVGGAARANIVPIDAYYRDFSHISAEERARLNFDHPDSLEAELLVQHLASLQNGEAVDVPVYDFSTHRRQSEQSRHVTPTDIIIVEGILALHYPALQAAYAYSIFVETDDKLRFTRRLERDVRERGRTSESVHAQWSDTVAPMHEQFCAPTRLVASEVVRGESWDDQMVADLWNRILDAVEVKGA